MAVSFLLSRTYAVGSVLESAEVAVWFYAGEYSKELHAYVCVRTLTDNRESITRYISRMRPHAIVPIKASFSTMELHADDGPAYVVISGTLDRNDLFNAALTAHTRPDVVEYEYQQHGSLAAPPGYDGSVAVMASNTALRWMRNHQMHRAPDENGVDRPAQIMGRGLLKPPGDPDRIEYAWSYYADLKRHREVGPCDVDHSCICSDCPQDIERSNKCGIRIKAGPPYRLEWKRKDRDRLDGPISVTCKGIQYWSPNVYRRRPCGAYPDGKIEWGSDAIPEVYSRYTHREFPADARMEARAIVACSARPDFLAVDLRTWIVEIDYSGAA
jgi:hypothetical protein